jgi:transforming growth factor-beta-induced protein
MSRASFEPEFRVTPVLSTAEIFLKSRTELRCETIISGRLLKFLGPHVFKISLQTRIIMKFRKLLIFAGTLFAFGCLAYADHHEKKDIVDTAVAAGSFKTLAAALGAADLVDALKSEGPFTVFAPTDDAFAKLPAGTVEMLLKPANKDKLVDVLTYHVIPARVLAVDAVKLTEATALNEKTIKLNVRDGALYLNDAKVIKTDIETSNGIIHVIDTVLLPPTMVSSNHDSQKMGEIAQGIVGLAIQKGVPLFNQGNHEACAAIYEMAAETLLMMPEDELGSAPREMLQSALRQVAGDRHATNNAWTMRRALDSIMQMEMAMSR